MSHWVCIKQINLIFLQFNILNLALKEFTSCVIFGYRNTDILSSAVPVQNETPNAVPKLPTRPVQGQLGLPPPPLSPNAPELPPIIDQLKGNNKGPKLNTNPLPFLPAIDEGTPFVANNGWVTQGVINEDGEWVTGNDNSDSSLFNIEDGEDILKR